MKNIDQSDTQPLHKKATENSNIDIDGLIYQNREKSSEYFAQTYSYNSINQKFGNSKIRYLPIVLAYLLEFEFASLKSYVWKRDKTPVGFLDSCYVNKNTSG